MRCFIAIDLPKEIKDYLFKLKNLVKGAKVKWVAKKHHHLTIKFFGELSEGEVIELRVVLKEINVKPFKVKLHKLGFFPTESNPRVIWVDLKPDKDVIDIQKHVDSATLKISALDTRFQTHVTLGRVKEIKNKKEFKESIENMKIEPLEFEIKEFKLFKSILSKEGSTYEVIEKFS